MSELIMLRHAVPGDLAFIYRTWLSDLRAADRSALPNDLWFPPHREAIGRVLSDPSVAVMVLAPSDNPDEILGYAVAEEKKVLHWVFLRPELRGRQSGLVPRMLGDLAPPGTPAAWQHPNGRHLRNPPRPRWARTAYASSSPEMSK
jgi:hypothetical protein